ncbi:hypothetical protein M5689_006297 [Euphorbia peplus]|nr:hypothetical protein M5689_006297 [Euphorbia peplus]
MAFNAKTWFLAAFYRIGLVIRRAFQLIYHLFNHLFQFVMNVLGRIVDEPAYKMLLSYCTLALAAMFLTFEDEFKRLVVHRNYVHIAGISLVIVLIVVTLVIGFTWLWLIRTKNDNCNEYEYEYLWKLKLVGHILYDYLAFKAGWLLARNMPHEGHNVYGLLGLAFLTAHFMMSSMVLHIFVGPNKNRIS